MGGGTGIGGGGAHLCGKVKLLDRKLKRADKKNGFQKQEKQTISPQEPPGNSPHSTVCLCDGSTIIARQKTNQSKE